MDWQRPDVSYHAHFDCFSGAAGDMLLASCLDSTGDPQSADRLLKHITYCIEEGLPELKGEFTIERRRVWKGGMASIAATHVTVHSRYGNKPAPVPSAQESYDKNNTEKQATTQPKQLPLAQKSYHTHSHEHISENDHSNQQQLVQEDSQHSHSHLHSALHDSSSSRSGHIDHSGEAFTHSHTHDHSSISHDHTHDHAKEDLISPEGRAHEYLTDKSNQSVEVSTTTSGGKFDNSRQHHDHSHDHGQHSDTGCLRNYSQIRKMLQDAPIQFIPPWVREMALKAFTELATAEARSHGVESLDAVHFHEVGAVDSIVDTVGTLLALYSLGVTTFSCSRLPMGEGMVWTDHGRLPVPAPATLFLYEGMPTCSGPPGWTGELVTPTGAALLRVLTRQSSSSANGRPPSFTIRFVGIGAGTKDFQEHPNILRLILGNDLLPSTASRRLKT